MIKNVLNVGIDIDDKAYHVSVFYQVEDSSFEFKTGPYPEQLVRGLKHHDIDPTRTQNSQPSRE